LIRIAEARLVAHELHNRYDHPRAVTLIGRILQKALFAGKSDEVVFWAIVHAHYCSGLGPDAEDQLDAFEQFIQRKPRKAN